MLTANVTRLLGSVILSVTLIAFPAFACELAGPDTHVGEIKAIDLTQASFTIIDGQMKKPLTFLATPKQLKELSPGQLVVVKYSKVGGQLRAEEIEAR
jgi:hypothetical protein